MREEGKKGSVIPTTKLIPKNKIVKTLREHASEEKERSAQIPTPHSN
jgi:hypothetical protein